MRKQDLKVGEEYAAGSSSRYDRWKMGRVRVVEVDGQRKRENGTMKRGIVVALVVDGDTYAWPRYLRGEAGTECVIDSARDIQMPWTDYERAKAEFDARQESTRIETIRAAGVSDVANKRLSALGVTFARSGSGFQFSADEMAKLVALIPDGRSNA